MSTEHYIQSRSDGALPLLEREYISITHAIGALGDRGNRQLLLTVGLLQRPRQTAGG